MNTAGELPLPATPIEMTQALLGEEVPYFLDERQQLALAAPQELDTAAVVTRGGIYVGLLRLIVKERGRLREQARDEALGTGDITAITPEWRHNWDTHTWQFTSEFRNHIRNKYPLIIRQAAKAVLRISNAERMQDTEYKTGTQLVPFSTILQSQEAHSGKPRTAEEVARYLGRAGYYGSKNTLRNPRSRFVRPLPADAIQYLRAYPLSDPPLPGEQYRVNIYNTLLVGTGTLDLIIDELNVYPMVRTTQEYSKETICLKPADALRIEATLEDVLPISEADVALSRLRQHYTDDFLLSLAQKLNNIPTIRRYKNNKRHPVDCIAVAHRVQLLHTYKVLLRLQETGAGILSFTPKMLQPTYLGKSLPKPPPKRLPKKPLPRKSVSPPTFDEPIQRPFIQPSKVRELPLPIAGSCSIDEISDQLNIPTAKVREAASVVCGNAPPITDIRVMPFGGELQEKAVRVYSPNEIAAIAAELGESKGIY